MGESTCCARFARWMGVWACCASLAGAQWSVVETQQVPTGLGPLVPLGNSLAIDGDRALAGTFAPVAVYDIDPATGLWTETGALTASSYDYGWTDVDLSGDTAVVGAPDGIALPPDQGKVRVFERDPSTGAWSQTAVILSPGNVADFGRRVGISGDTVVTSGKGTVLVYERDQGGPGAWGSVAILSEGDGNDFQLGTSLDVEGDLIVAGAPRYEHEDQDTGGVFVYGRTPSGWTTTVLVAGDAGAGDELGSAVALSGDTLIAGAPGDDLPGLADAGSATVFQLSGGRWLERATVVAAAPFADQRFGSSLGLDQDTAVVADRVFNWPDSVTVLERDQGAPDAWQPVAQLAAPPGFDGTVAVHSSSVVVDDANRVYVSSLGGLAYDPGAAVLYAAGWLTSSPDVTPYLFALDVASGESTPIGPLGHAVNALAYDPSTGWLYGTDYTLALLVRIDPATGAGTAIGPLGYQAPEGLDLDPATGTLYGTDTSTDLLYVIDVQTGAGTPVGSLGFNLVRGLAFDPTTGTLYGSNAGPQGKLITIDTATGQGTVVGTIGAGVEGLAFGPGGELYGTRDEQLVEIDALTGVGTVIGDCFVADTNHLRVLELEHTAETYCTAGTSASGCTALIGASGTASASAPSGFQLSASGVEGAKDGLFFFGTSGKQANPWGNGTSYQCVAPPVRRGGLLSGVGTAGSCDGAFAQDLNALWCPTCPKPLANPGAGSMAQAQLWYRDPAGTSNQSTSLSDAVEFHLQP